MCLMFEKLACPFGQVKTKMHLPESPIFKNSLAGASGLVLMSVPGQSNLQTITFETSEGSENT